MELKKRPFAFSLLPLAPSNRCHWLKLVPYSGLSVFPLVPLPLPTRYHILVVSHMYRCLLIWDHAKPLATESVHMRVICLYSPFPVPFTRISFFFYFVYFVYVGGAGNLDAPKFGHEDCCEKLFSASAGFSSLDPALCVWGGE